MAMNIPFDHSRLDWGARDLYSEFQRFKQHVEFTCQGPLAGTEKKVLACWVGMWIGQEGREIYKTLDWKEGEKDDNTKILNKFEEYVSPKKNKRIARFKAQQRKQKESEPFDSYIKDLKLLVMDCEYTDSSDILIDLIINGVRQPKVQERMLNKGKDLTLNDAIDIGQQFELAQTQLKLMRGEEVLQVKSKTHSPKLKFKSKAKPWTKGKPSANQPNKFNCTRCGKLHETGSCPAKVTTCSYCHLQDHWAKVCRKRLGQKKVYVVQGTDSDHDTEDALHIDVCTDVCTAVISDKWDTELVIQGKNIQFKIDTGAKCNIITKNALNDRPVKPILGRSARTLKSFTNHINKPVGTADMQVRHKGARHQIQFEVVDINNENIQSGNTAEQIGLIQRTLGIQETQVPQPDHELFREFPELVKTTGTLPGENSIEIDESISGVVHPVRKLPAAIKPKAIEALREMEQNEYITRMDEPTEWVSSMVVSLRKDKVRICLDPKDLNKAVKRAHHPMKTVEEVVQNIPGAKVFSVLDAKSGFLQIKLDQKSSYLTTFNTPLGRFRWLRLPFGIKCAPEIYQKIMDQMITGIDGAFAIIDDILIAGKDVTEHYRILKEVVSRATSYNLKLNFNKCLVRQPSVRYMGHLVTEHGLMADQDNVFAIVNMPAPTDKEGVRRLLGLVQYLAKFIPNMSEVDTPIRTLLKSDIEFEWGHTQVKSFEKLKKLCSSPPVLAYYDVSKEVQIECDASKNGLGGVIMQSDKEELGILHDIIVKGWPDTRSETPFETRPYWDSRDQLSVLDSIVYKGLRIVIPPSLRDNMLRLVHKTHLGLGKSKQRAREVMYWPRMNSDIDTMVSNCSVCAEQQNQQPAEPLKPTLTPDLPYDMVGCDVFQFRSEKYLVIVDYYSKYIDTEKLESETTSDITSALMKVFSSHGISNTLRSDNGPQFSSRLSVRSMESFIKLPAHTFKARTGKPKELYRL
ncbi:uncharacterized protein K02A2.6-like [Mya arenaria]|uniref:uncharacterized protein K02A2.6-like n=1 Tax=Mya arenaria TaxID=6604 RepID=UPI0022E056DB|nr:uncharacterized protein K02A2.6-like [Mya arenaria]